ncbi:MAG: hypothetical protein ACT4QD_12505 [Acidobacteriota bacterium]
MNDRLAHTVAVVSTLGYVATSLCAPLPVLAQPDPVETVLSRAADYVDRLQMQLSGIVAEEAYEQVVTPTFSVGGRAQTARRRIKSDLLLVKTETSDRYVEFRDVFEVDGRAVRDRTERLTKLFLDPTLSGGQRFREVVSESARYNIGNVSRTMNTPMLPLMFLLDRYQRRFDFSLGGDRSPEIVSRLATDAAREDFRVHDTVLVVAFEEVRSPTVVTGLGGADFPSKGRFWIQPDSGAVLMTELVLEDRDLRAVVSVSYQSEPLLGFRVPVAMRERYRLSSELVDGAATYGRFRRFSVNTDEVIAPPSEKATPAPAEPPTKPPKPPPPGA